MRAGWALAPMIVLATVSACAVAAHRHTSYPTPTGHAREELDARTGIIHLHFDAVSVAVGLREGVPGKTETLWVGVAPIPQATGETDELRAQRNARIRFWISVEPNERGVAFTPMKTTLRKGTAEAVFPIGYLMEHDYLYSDIYPLENGPDSVSCASNTEFNLVYQVTYDPNANYVLAVDGLSKDGIAIQVPPIGFVPKRISWVRS